MTETPVAFSWSAHYARRRAIRARWPSVWALPVVKRFSDVVAAQLHPGARVLDVGASDGALHERLRRGGTAITYETLDIDPALAPTYRSFADVTARVDVVTLGEVIEHLTFEAGGALLGDICRALKPGGCVVVSTPNLAHPHRYFEDADHRTPYWYEVLGARLAEAGFEVAGLFRTYNAPLLQRFLHRVVLHPLHRALSVDYALSIVAVGAKPVAGPARA